MHFIIHNSFNIVKINVLQNKNLRCHKTTKYIKLNIFPVLPGVNLDRTQSLPLTRNGNQNIDKFPIGKCRKDSSFSAKSPQFNNAF